MHCIRGLTAPLIVTIVLALGVTGCSDVPSPEDVAASEASEADEARLAACRALAEDITATLQSYVDQFSSEIQGGLDTEVPSIGDLQDAAEEFGRRRAAAGCGAREFQLLFNRALEDLEGEGPLGLAVTARVRDEVAPVLGPAATVTVAPGDDLVAAVHGAGAGAVVRLEAGRHELDEPLVLLRETRLIGAGAEATTVASSAPGAVVLHAGDDRLSLEGIAFAHEGDEPASVLVAPRGRHDLRDVTVRGGVADEGASTGWGLVLGASQDAGGSADDLQVTGVLATENEAGGIAVTGGSPRLSEVVARDNGGCGICWLGDATGSLTGAEAAGNGIGLSVSGTAAPGVEDVVASGNTQAGILLEGTAGGGEFTGVEVTGNGQAGLVVRGGSTATIRGLVSEQHDQSGVVVEGEGAPDLGDVEVREAAVGVLVRDAAAPTLDGVVVTGVTEAHMVFTDDAGGRVTDATCESSPVGIALLGATEVEITGGGCEVVDQRGD